MIVPLVFIAHDSQLAASPYEETMTQQERRVRDLVMLVVRASGAGLRSETFRVPREDEIVGSFVGVDSSNPRFNFLKFIGINGAIHQDGSVDYSWSGWRTPLPLGTRRWTTEECEEAARHATATLLPPELRVGPTMAKSAGPSVVRVTTQVVAAVDPRVRVRVTTQEVDTAIGLPRSAEISKTWKKIVPERAVARVSEPTCKLEAERVYRQIAPFLLAKQARSEYVYSVPSFSLSLNEMTDTHRELTRRRECTVIYQWEAQSAANPSESQFVWVDGLTGRAIAWAPALNGDITRSGLSAGDARSGLKSISLVESTSLWMMGNASGHLHLIDGPAIGGAPHVLTNKRGEMLLVHLDVKRGLVEATGRTYRPDAALLEALRAEGPPVPFGRK